MACIQHTREETEVLFSLLAERCERRSVVVTTNPVLSEWDHTLKNPMTTAIDRIVHEGIIIEFGKQMSSPRAEEAARHNRGQSQSADGAF